MADRYFVLGRHVREGGAWSDWERVSEWPTVVGAKAEIVRLREEFTRVGGPEREQWRVFAGSREQLDEYLRGLREA